MVMEDSLFNDVKMFLMIVFLMMLYRYVIVYIIVHPRYLSIIVHESFHLIHTQHCRQIVLCTNVFLATQTDVE